MAPAKKAGVVNLTMGAGQSLRTRPYASNLHRARAVPDRHSRRPGAMDQAYAQSLTLRRFGKAVGGLPAQRFISRSDASSYMTGQVLRGRWWGAGGRWNIRAIATMRAIVKRPFYAVSGPKSQLITLNRPEQLNGLLRRNLAVDLKKRRSRARRERSRGSLDQS